MALFLALSLPVAVMAGDLKYGDNPHLDELFAELQTPGADTRITEREIARIFRQSGSEAMDLLLARGYTAIEAGNASDAVWHLSALIDHAPDFAEGYNARATAFYDMDEYGLAVEDIHRTLALNPRHFSALTGLGIISEELGKYEVALAAYLAARTLHPNYSDIDEAIERVQAQVSVLH